MTGLTGWYFSRLGKDSQDFENCGLLDLLVFTCYILLMFTKSDKKWLRENFATKDDLKNLATKDDFKKLDKKLDKKFTDLFDFLDKDVMETKRKITTIEQALQISPVS